MLHDTLKSPHGGGLDHLFFLRKNVFEDTLVNGLLDLESVRISIGFIPEIEYEVLTI